MGGFLPIPHGVVCGTLMAAAVRANWQAMKAREPGNEAIAKMARLGQRLSKESGKSDAYYCDALVAILEDWTEQLELPRLNKYDIQTSDLNKILDQTQNRNNPIELTRNEIRALVEARL
ncbi:MULTISPECIES: iron-containing alcohol dehydrogenase [unclassified Leptolyngbya]|uniref:iron-containing alcohol dehydrogenase n=1 Tax=unclassified Leptolyngbya TaxID=2650499 RepID=UPI001F553AF0|nr:MULTISPECIES: iron-containing alcohol dehydrogenase [unclassified Leptolyngbya]